MRCETFFSHDYFDGRNFINIIRFIDMIEKRLLDG